MIANECPYFDSCNAPICPLDENKEKAIWYSDEAICKNRDFFDLEYIKTQKKIAKVNKTHNVKGYFTLKMLNQKIIIRSGIQGINEDTPIDSSILEENWLRKHRPISKEVIEKRRVNMKKAREVLEP
ncbi:MAG: hypothetical protein RXP30_01275 [Thermoplasmata archaeon]|nr:hypothetical protein [Euryarchaeota archaeon]